MGKFFFLFITFFACFTVKGSEKVTKVLDQNAYERMEEPVNGDATIKKAWIDEHGVFHAMDYIPGQIFVMYPERFAKALYQELSTAYVQQQLKGR